jgi:hypothetical protein
VGQREPICSIAASDASISLYWMVVVETPQLGHATFLFAKPTSTGDFLALYRLFTREDILHNRNNAAERLQAIMEESECLARQFPDTGLAYPHGQRRVTLENRWLRFL